MRAITVTMTLLVASGVAFADEPATDGYCDYVEGVAAATSAVLIAPTVFGQFGLIDQGPTSVNPEPGRGNLRLIAGAQVNLDGIVKARAIRGRARAACRRHTALEAVRSSTAYQALEARAQVLDGALAESATLLDETAADLAARRITAIEATATQLRVEALRQLKAQTAREMLVLPKPSGAITGAISTFERADAEVERYDGKLRRAQAFDVSVRFGVDRFIDDPDSGTSPYFAVLAVGINLGVLFQGRANDRASAGRQRLVRSGRDPDGGDASIERLRASIEAETVREQQIAALELELARQLEELTRLGGDASKRYRETVWFEWVKIKAEHAYLVAHLRALHQVTGEPAP